MKAKPMGRISKTDLKAQLAWAENELRETLDKAQSLSEYIAATRKLCGKKGPASTRQDLPGVAVIPHRRRTKTAVLASQVVEVLRSAGQAMHVRDIVGELGKRGQPVIAKNPTNTVAVALARRSDQFAKVSPNTFDLVNKEGIAAETA